MPLYVMCLVNECPGHSLSITYLVIILLKSQLLQFPMHLMHNFLLKTYYLKCLKSAPGALVNISHMLFISLLM